MYSLRQPYAAAAAAEAWRGVASRGVALRGVYLAMEGLKRGTQLFGRLFGGDNPKPVQVL